MNIITLLEFELTYFEAKVHHVSYYTREIPQALGGIILCYDYQSFKFFYSSTMNISTLFLD